ncbi:unnamed protein product, partial [Discosporangium mesarthrocarpum]
DAGFPTLARAFEATARHGRLQSVNTTLAGRHIFLRFRSPTG